MARHTEMIKGLDNKTNTKKNCTRVNLKKEQVKEKLMNNVQMYE